ncbi:MAG: prepilin-type N-terminal cleavage/methylation domain-containing protein [Deltaproteobacteria bacterium]
MHCLHSRRGFTLIEVLTVVAVVGVLAGLSAISLTRLKARGSFSSATGDFMSTLRTARAEAFARGDDTVVVVDVGAGRWWSVEDVNGDFALDSFDPANPAPAPDRLMSSGELPAAASFGPQDGWGRALAPPLGGIPTGYTQLPDGGTADISADGGSAAPNFKYCSFCDLGTKRGAVTFLPSGGARFSGGPLTIGQQISMQDVSGDAGTPTGIIDFAIVATTGSVQAVTIR